MIQIPHTENLPQFDKNGDEDWHIPLDPEQDEDWHLPLDLEEEPAPSRVVESTRARTGTLLPSTRMISADATATDRLQWQQFIEYKPLILQEFRRDTANTIKLHFTNELLGNRDIRAFFTDKLPMYRNRRRNAYVHGLALLQQKNTAEGIRDVCIALDAEYKFLIVRRLMGYGRVTRAEAMALSKAELGPLFDESMFLNSWFIIQDYVNNRGENIRNKEGWKRFDRPSPPPMIDPHR